MSTYAGLLKTFTLQKLTRDYENGLYDPGTLAGTVKTKTAPTTLVPTFAKVVVYRDSDNVAVRKGFSDPATGAWSFDRLDKFLTYTAIAYHPTLAYRAVVADGINPT